MSGRSPSGVASLRARFEQNADPESFTPSRGRSPAGSVNSDTSRPLSKVRTSFISVGEPSGQMSDLLDVKEAAKPISVDGAEESMAKEHSKLNGNGPTSAPKQAAEYPIKTLGDQKAPEPSMTMPEKPDERSTGSSLATTDTGKPETGAEGSVTSTPHTGSKSEGAASEGEGVVTDSPNLGSILKGSAFEKEKAKKEPVSQKSAENGAPKTTGKTGGGPKTSTVPAIADPVKPLTAIEKAANGKSKESQAPQTKPQTKPASEQLAATKTQAAPKPGPITNTKPSSKEPEKKDIPAKAAPAATGTSSNKDNATKPTPAPPVQTGTTAAAAAPKKEPSPKKLEPSIEPTKEAITTPKPSTILPDRKVTHPSGTSKPSNSKAMPSLASATTKPPPKKIVHPASPPTSGTGFAKPKPPSPTRPVNLPAHLMAQTAASAAKHGDDSHVEPHKDQSAGNSKSPGLRAPTFPPPQQRKPPRASMPAAGSSKPAEKEKAKPRMSVASGSAPGGSFLERMMRPTQSSAQKTHERVEPGKNSPPRKLSGSRNVSGAGPKTVTGASTHKPDQHAQNDGGHGVGRENHGGPTKGEIEHGKGQEARGTAKGKESVTTAADSKASAPKAEPASAPEEVMMPVSPSITEGKPKGQVAPPAEPGPGMQTF